MTDNTNLLTDLLESEEDILMDKSIDMKAYSSIKPKDLNLDNPYEKKFKDYGVLNLQL